MNMLKLNFPMSVQRDVRVGNVIHLLYIMRLLNLIYQVES
jgi:hypothetical protein